MSRLVVFRQKLGVALVALICCSSAAICVAADKQTKKGAQTMSQQATPKVIDEENLEVDQWPFTIRTLQTSDRYAVMAFLRNMPVSHEYVVDRETFLSQKAAGNDPLKKLKELARKDLKAGLYRTWVIHWASQ